MSVLVFGSIGPWGLIMGQAHRVVPYDRAANVANAIPALQFNGFPLWWHRLDDGIMGGRSESLHSAALGGDRGVHFKGTINTNGGGFTSIRAPLPEGGLPRNTDSILIRYHGDGKTYKVLLKDRENFGDLGRTATWQVDLPTHVSAEADRAAVVVQEARLPLAAFRPSFGPWKVSEEELASLRLVPSAMQEIGLMLSLKLSDGSPNPLETFGEGIFDFSLLVHSLEPGVASEHMPPNPEASRHEKKKVGERIIDGMQRAWRALFSKRTASDNTHS